MVFQEDDCTTPHYQPGSCIALSECGHIRKLLTGRLSGPAHSYLRRSVCRFSGGEEKCEDSQVTSCCRWSPARLLSRGASGAGLDWLDLLDLHHALLSQVRGREQEEDQVLQRTGQRPVSRRESPGGQL